jgi:hypothetical protein
MRQLERGAPQSALAILAGAIEMIEGLGELEERRPSTSSGGVSWWRSGSWCADRTDPADVRSRADGTRPGSGDRESGV